MKFNANVVIGIINVEGGPDRVTIVLDPGIRRVVQAMEEWDGQTPNVE